MICVTFEVSCILTLLIALQKEIGWREKARRLLLFSTDSGFHYAGDGKLGGIVKPNDGQCHLERGEYTQSVHQDYPSLSQINAKIQEHKVNIIFAVTADQISVYEKLGNQLEGCSSGRLENDSSNVVQLVREQYDKISSKVEIKDNVTSSHIQISYTSSCLGDKKEKTNVCKGLKVGDNVTFEAMIEVKSCPKDRSQWNQTIQIYPVGISESLVVHLEMICECDCEKPWNEVKNRAAVSVEAKICSGYGECICGQCKCLESDEERYSGVFCEDCPTCPGKCEAFKDCVLCQVFQLGPYTEEECKTKCEFLAIQAPHIEVNEEGEKLCIFRDEDDCKYTFIYKLEPTNEYTVRAKNERECPKPVNIWAIILGVILGIVLIGLALLLIWKLFTTIHDRREFAKFEKERQMAKWDTGENPIYKGAVSTFKNPTYGGKQ
ncbi:hypothetical protein HPB50_024645 [Hyalomma asiaticum]|uniref:Uncharacterized protein n=1 Tax=Hyalomma asiaticum TaxID=266040 RepID=A0ACB7SZP8_HYAAI|nr:hypothetical protein HPB50_024645 [Hyalomma asiaticum]